MLRFSGIITQIYIVCGYTDMRRSIDSLAAIISQNYGFNISSGSMFLFCGKKCNRIKALMWDNDGFLLLYKRLDNGSFKWPRNSAQIRQLTKEQYVWLMQGLTIDPKETIKRSAYPPDMM